MIQPDGQYRHKWRKGDIVIWDNRCSYHKAAGDYPPEEDRIHWRVSIRSGGGRMTIVARMVTLEHDGIPGYMAHPERAREAAGDS